MINSCATIFYSNKQEIEFVSEEPGMKVYVDGDFAGVTPVKYKIKSRSNYATVFFKQDDVALEKYIRKTEFAGGGRGFFCMIDFFPGMFLILPVIVDAASGSCLRYKDKYMLSDGLVSNYSVRSNIQLKKV